MGEQPVKATLYAYDVYFGDCFLLAFEYASGEKRFVLIDFGSTGKGKAERGAVINENDADPTGARLREIAAHIKKTCNGKLHIVVATHRHKDHIYGFGLDGAGEIIMACDPDIVVQPWTENPADNTDLTQKSLVSADAFKAHPRQHFAQMLDNMHEVAESIEFEASRLGDENVYHQTISSDLQERILFTADDNGKIKNRKAVENLNAMATKGGRKPDYVSFGHDTSEWEKIIPGVKIHILGPPTLEQSDAIRSATSTSGEFWSLQEMNSYFWGVQSSTSRSAGGVGKPIFGNEKIMKTRPANVRWVVRQLRNVRASQLLEIVRFVDSSLNNTSVIMLFEVGGQKLLFPGDAQIENWQYALEKAKTDDALSKLLTETTLYKVGHHGSRNATPKSLWEAFEKVRSKRPGGDGLLKTVVSTMKGKHGETPDTAVPLPKMVDTMKKESDYTSTEDILNDIVAIIDIPLG
jgi:beta-lactamase superfamily II metal-dependent hydrolase